MSLQMRVNHNGNANVIFIQLGNLRVTSKRVKHNASVESVPYRYVDQETSCCFNACKTSHKREIDTVPLCSSGNTHLASISVKHGTIVEFIPFHSADQGALISLQCA